MTKAKVASAIATGVILAIISTLFGLSILVSSLLGFPSSLSLPIVVRIIVAVMVAAALVVVGWLSKYRSPSKMIVSTYFTFSKMFKRAQINEAAGRTEPLIISGPQKYVRHPLYFGATLIVFGWGLMTATTYLLIASAAMLTWFLFVQIPFEERELRALFGDQYIRYAENTPMLVPFTRRRPNSH